MAKKSAIEKNNKRIAMARKTAAKRTRLKAEAKDKSLSPEEQFQARMKLAAMPRNANPTRIRNRCQVTGRPRAVYRKFKMSRISLRDLASAGLIPGVVKSSW
ncbi:MAG: 30S ribosomal protein S14 [Sphingomonadales bacterium]